MGLRAVAASSSLSTQTSKQQSNATNATMAPALTEPTVNQTKLTASTTAKIASVSSAVSPRLSNISAKDILSKGAFQLAFEKHILSDGPNTGPLISLPMDHENSVTNENSNKVDDSPPATILSQQYYISNQPHNNNKHIQNNQHIIITNNNNTMGLQKEREKENAEMEQMLELSTEIDLLQVIKSLESAPELNCDLAGGLSLFNDEDVINMCSVEEVQTPCKDNETAEIRADIARRQAQMQRKCDFLLRRLRKIQSRQMGQHVSEEVGGLYSDFYRLYKKKEREAQKLNNSDENHIPPATTVNHTLFNSAEKNKPISSNAMKTFLKKINNVSITQSASIAKQNQMLKLKHETSCGSSSNSKAQHNLVSLIPEMDDKSAQKLDQVAGTLQTELRLIETAIDSDATASSSGGESADESIGYNNATQETLSISKRAAWRWARDRASVASRWSWLLAQISDLEYRIRQHNELHNQIRKNKGAVLFEDSPTGAAIQQPPSQQSVNGYRGLLPGNSKPIETDLPNGAFDPGVANNSSRTRPFQRNGFRKRKLLQTVNLHTISKKAARPSTVKCGCQWPLHPCALCTGRQDPTAPRDLPDTMPPSDRVALLDPCFHSVLSFPEDVSQSIHFEAIMRLPEWQNKAMRSTTKTSMKCALAAQKAAEREDRSKKFLDSRRKFSKKFGLVANKLKKAKSRRALHGGKFSHPLKSKHRKVSGSLAPSSGSDTTLHHHHHHLEHDHESGGVLGGGGSGINTGGGLGTTTSSTFSLPRSKNSSPTPNHSSNLLNHKSDRPEARRSRSSYDIDNIIIPYSVAASTRVELLPYKEIPTPNWRIIEAEGLDAEVELEEQENKLDNNETSQCVEDICDETIQQKHERALLEERKKFQTYLKFPWSTRSRANRRTDSRAESSGANTPDPTSPAPNTPSIPADQESIPSPANPSTPLAVENPDTTDNSSTSFLSTNIQPISGSNGKRPIERRRTVSLKLAKDRELLRDEARRSNTPDVKEIVPPYDALEFPIPESIYDDMMRIMPSEHKTLIENCLNEQNTYSSSNSSNNNDRHLDKNDTDNNNGTIGVASCNSAGILLSPILEHAVTIASTRILDDETVEDDHSNSHSHHHDPHQRSSDPHHDDMLLMDDDSESMDSVIPEEDPNDPEWQQQDEKITKHNTRLL